MRLIVGISACATIAGERPVHRTPARYGAAVIGGVEALPIMIPPIGDGNWRYWFCSTGCCCQAVPAMCIRRITTEGTV